MFRFVSFSLIVLFFFAGCHHSDTPPSVTSADLVIHGGKIYTMNPNQPVAQAIAVHAGRILKVGDYKSIQAHIGAATKVITLENELVLPGFIEGHGHFLGLGKSRMNLRLGDTRHWQEVIAKVADLVKTTPTGHWITGRGWHQEKWDQPPATTIAGFPTHETLSAISPEHPVLLRHASGHALFANAKAMTLAGINDQTANPAGGEIIRDSQGKAIGIFSETAQALVGMAFNQWQANKSAETRTEDNHRAISLAVEECLSKGITSFQDAGSSFADVDFFRQLVDKDQLGVRLWVMLSEGDEQLLSRGNSYVAPQIQTNQLVVGGIKRYIDGALGSRGAWLLHPYKDAPDSTGQNVMSLAALRNTAKIAIDLGLQLCTHAIGDRGNREVLDIYSDFVKDQDLRWRIEHAQHLHRDDIPRFAQLGVIASMQGIHCTSDAPFVEKRLGSARAEEGAYVWRKLVASGAMISNGTDAPVEDVDPLANLHAMVTRLPQKGSAFYPAQALTIHEALKTYTLNNAYAVFQESQKGSLEVGKLADITILTQDITVLPAESIRATKVRLTIVGGVIKFGQ